MPVRFSPLWPAFWVAAVDKTKTSKSAEVQGIWEIYDKALEFIPVGQAIAIRDALLDRDASAAWTAGSSSAEHVLDHAFCLAGGPVPPGGLVKGRGSAALSEGFIGGNRIHKLRYACADLAHASEVHFFRDTSVAPILRLRSKLVTVLNLLQSFCRGGFTMERALYLDELWGSVVSGRPVGVFDWDLLVGCPNFGLDGFCDTIADIIARITELIQKVVQHRKESAIRSWRSWVLEDPLVHPYRWLRPDNVPPPAPFLSCDPAESVDGSGVLVNPQDIDRHFSKAWMPFFCRGHRGRTDLDAFRAVAEDLIPVVDEVQLPPLTGDMLYETVQSKKPSSGSLDGWGWKEFKALPPAWFDRLASIFLWLRRRKSGQMVYWMVTSL